MNLLLVEGADDRAAVREILTRHLQLSKVRSDIFTMPERADAFRGQAVVLHVLVVDEGKTKLGQRLTEQIPTGRWTRIGLVFDPDHDDDVACDRWFQRLLPPGPTTATPLGVRLDDSGIEVLALPWKLGAVFDQLEAGWHALERVGLEILSRADPEEAKLVDEMLGVLRREGRSAGWHEAFRLWHAVRAPKSGWVDKVFGQDPGLRQKAVETMAGSKFLDKLTCLTQP
ncbi:MAG: hypothetical protein AB1758_09455 [Candidatus Eremiobacterota bacterium]